MELAAPSFLPDPELSRAEMEAMQREVAAAARFVDDVAADPADLRLDTALDDPGPDCLSGAGGDAPADAGPSRQTTLDASTDTDSVTGVDAGVGADSTDGAGDTDDAPADAPTVVGVDQAFLDDAAVSVAVAIRDGRVVECAAGRAPLEFPYVPGLLSFREAGAIADALASLSATPDLLVLDGSGRIHYRQAGIATHVGVLFDVPAVGVAKNLLCGRPRAPLDDPLPEDERVAVETDDGVEPLSTDDPDWPVIGYAYQSRQFADTERRHVNPLYVSPGHRTGAATAVDLVAATCAGYKLPEPTRLADAVVDRLV